MDATDVSAPPCRGDRTRFSAAYEHFQSRVIAGIEAWNDMLFIQPTHVLDRSLQGRIYHNIFKPTGLDGQAFPVMILFADGPGESSWPDAFFAMASRQSTLPTLMVYVSPDESVLGRCGASQKCDENVAVTIVDADLFDMSTVITEYMAVSMMRYVSTFTELMRVRQPLLLAENDDAVASMGRLALSDAISDGSHLVVLRCKEELRYTRTPCKRADIQRAANATALLAHARGPVKTIDLETVGCTACTIMGGDVALVCGSCGSGVHTVPSTEPALGACRVIFITGDPLHLIFSPGSVHLDETFGTNRLVISATEGPPAHLAHVIERASTVALQLRAHMLVTAEWNPGLHQELMTLVSAACDHYEHEWALGARVAATHVVRAMDRLVDANLASIKAKLWAPDAPLCRKFMFGGSGEGNTMDLS